jgi:hypothetical protein
VSQELSCAALQNGSEAFALDFDLSVCLGSGGAAQHCR